jgi:chromosome partitioning protein
VIDGGGCSGRAWRPALIAAHLALVPLAALDADLEHRYRLASCLNAARMFNPGLRVLFVTAGDGADTAALAPVRRYAAEVMAAHVAATVLDAASLRVARAGACACDDPGTPACAALEALYAEVYGQAGAVRSAGHVPTLHAFPQD